MEQLWSLALLAIILGPVVAAIVIGLLRRDAGSPRADDTSEVAAYAQIARDLRDVQNGGRGW